VLKGQIDIAARMIWLAEKLGWAFDVRWPDQTRLTGKQTGASRKLGSMTKPATAAHSLTGGTDHRPALARCVALACVAIGGPRVAATACNRSTCVA
jgi:hypothetical protein